MWMKALKVIPEVDLTEWKQLDIFSRWLIASRAAVLIMTFIASALAGLFALRYNVFHLLPWMILTLGLILAHAANNIFNDYTDFLRGVDKDNYFRTMYGSQPLSNGLLSKAQHLRYFFVTILLALASGLYFFVANNWDYNVLILIGLGLFFVLFYTWPLKVFAIGEIAVLIVWGPLMVGGGYYVLTGYWDWEVVIASLPYALGVTTVLFGKHIDKSDVDRSKNIKTLPVVLGDKSSRYIVILMMSLQYLFILLLIYLKFFTPILLITFLAFPNFTKTYRIFLKPKPSKKPEDFPDGQGGWPLFFAPYAFWHNRKFGFLFLLGIVFDLLIRTLFPKFWY